MGKKKNRSKHKNINRQQLNNGGDQEMSSNTMEAINQPCNCDVLKQENPGSLKNGQLLNSELCRESHEDISIVGESNINANSTCLEVSLNTTSDICNNLEGSTPTSTECFNPTTNSQPLISTSMENLTSEEIVCDTKNGNNSMSNSGKPTEEPQKMYSGEKTNTQSKSEDVIVVSKMENDQTFGAVKEDSFPKEDSKPKKENYDSFPQKLSPSSDDSCPVQSLITTVESVPQVQSEKALSNTIANENNKFSHNALKTQIEQCGCCFQDEVPISEKDRNENNIGTGMEKAQNGAVTITSIQRFESDSKPNESVEDIKEGSQNDCTQHFNLNDIVTTMPKQENSSYVPITKNDKDTDNECLRYASPSIPLTKEGSIDNSVERDSNEENIQMKNMSDLLQAKSCEGNGELIDRKDAVNSNKENQQISSKNDSMVNKNSNEKCEINERQKHQEIIGENQEEEAKSDSIVVNDSNMKPELTEMETQPECTDDNQKKDGYSNLITTKRSDEKAETGDMQDHQQTSVESQKREYNNHYSAETINKQKPLVTDMKIHQKPTAENQLREVNHDLSLVKGDNEKEEAVDKQALHESVENEKEVGNSDPPEASNNDNKTVVNEKGIGKEVGIGSQMDHSIEIQRDLSTNYSDECQTKKLSKKKLKQIEFHSPTETLGEDLSFRNITEAGNQEEKQEGNRPKIETNLLLEKDFQKENDMTTGDADKITEKSIGKISDTDINRVGDINDFDKVKSAPGEEKSEVGPSIQSNSKNKYNENNKSIALDVNTEFGSKKRVGRNERKKGANTTEQKTQALEGKTAGDSATSDMSGSGILLLNNEETFQVRPIFMANTCHVCKATHGGVTRLKSCSACRLIAYCSKEHQRKHWKEHKALCQQVQKRIKKSGLQDLYGDAYKITDAEEWRKARCYQIVYIEKHMGRTLMPYEKEMFLYPRVCNVCHRSDPEKLKVCKGCHFLNYCKNEHLPISHKVWCEDLKLLLQLNQYQSQYGLISPQLPHINLDRNKPLPKSMKDFFSIFLLHQQDEPHINLYEAVLSDIATCPLTIYYVLNLLAGESRMETCTKLTVHLVGAENQFEVEPLGKWDSFLLNLLSCTNELHLVFIGPELTRSDAADSDNYQRLDIKTINSSKKLTVEFYCGSLYHDYVNSTQYKRPDIICAFNCGIYRFTGFNNKDTWGPTITSMVKEKDIPVLLTAYTEVEAPKDVARFKKQCGSKELISTMKNPFSSMRPNLNFVSDDETPLIFKNQFLSVIRGCD